MTVYPIGDHHHGMRSWGQETGADYDIKISIKLLTSAAGHLIDQAPASETAMIVNVGDWFHVDNLANVTSRNGNTLDVDTRYAAMIRTGTMLMRSLIERALFKHKKVIVVCAIGNHDDVGSIWLQTALAMFYEKNPRVQVVTKPGKYHYHKHGKVLLGITHGDTGKPEKLQGVMAADVPELWGTTQFRHWLTGHVHTRRVLEFPGVMWETFRTLAPPDAWASAAAYRSGRDMTSIVFDKDSGEIGRSRFDVSMFADIPHAVD
jgi:acyl-CoA synthetase (AMP-forming)/AMP-acid ligase II